MIYIPATYFNK